MMWTKKHKMIDEVKNKKKKRSKRWSDNEEKKGEKRRVISEKELSSVSALEHAICADNA